MIYITTNARTEPAIKTATYHVIVTMAMVNARCLINVWIKMIQ